MKIKLVIKILIMKKKNILYTIGKNMKKEKIVIGY